MKNSWDRRSHVRLEVVGLLWGSLQITQQARVINLNTGGALISCPVRFPPGVIQSFQLVLNGQEVPVEARVRHVQFVPGSIQTEYQIGIEFLSSPADLN